MCNKAGFNNNWINHFANKWGSHQEHPFKKVWKEKMQQAPHNVPANVRELDDKFELHLIAPGFVKSDFQIAIVDKALSIYVEVKNETSETWKRQEYSKKTFERKFELNDKIDKTAIVAKYENGILILSLPKLEGHETERQAIEIA